MHPLERALVAIRQLIRKHDSLVHDTYDGTDSCQVMLDKIKYARGVHEELETLWKSFYFSNWEQFDTEISPTGAYDAEVPVTVFFWAPDKDTPFDYAVISYTGDDITAQTTDSTEFIQALINEHVEDNNNDHD